MKSLRQQQLLSARATSRIARMLVALVLLQLSGAASLAIVVAQTLGGRAADACCEDEREGHPCSPGCSCALCHVTHAAPALVPSALLSLLPRFVSETSFAAEPPPLAPRTAPLDVFRPPRQVALAFAS